MVVGIGVIGPGGMGKAHIARITRELSGGEIVAVTDIDSAVAASVADPLGAKIYPDDDTLVAAACVDAVIVTSSGPAHEHSVLAAISEGKPVLCEKPLCPTAAGCVRVMEAELRGGRELVTVGFMRRFDRSYGEIRALVDSGDLGRALIVHNRHRNPTVPESYTADMAINDTAIHEIDTMRWLLGEEIVAVRVDKPRSTNNRFPHLQDPLMLVMRTESGVIAYDEVFVNIQYGYDIRCEVVLETGTVELSDQNATVRRDGVGARNRITQDYDERFHAAFNMEVQQWINGVEHGEHAGSSAWDGYAAACVCDAGVRALNCDDDRWVPVDLISKPLLYL